MLTVTPNASRYVLTTGWRKDGPPLFYTGRGGDGWIGPKAEAFTYGHAEAKRKAELLNRMSAIHGFTFWTEAA